MSFSTASVSPPRSCSLKASSTVIDSDVHQEIRGNILSLTERAPTRNGLYCLTTWPESPTGRCKIL